MRRIFQSKFFHARRAGFNNNRPIRFNFFAQSHSSVNSMASNPDDLPLAVFANNHWDASTNRMLNRLSGHFKAVGYQNFLDEAPRSFSISDRIQYSKKMSDPKFYESTIKAFQKYGLDINCEKDIRKFVLLKSIETSVEISLADYALSHYINRYQDHQAVVKFLESLNNLGFQYRGVDFEEDDIAPDETTSKLRDKFISRSYVAFLRRSIGIMGLYHAPGVQANLVDAIGLESARRMTCFFYLFINKPLTTDDKFEEFFRQGRVKTPYEVMQLDLSKISEEEAEQRIKNKIAEKHRENQLIREQEDRIVKYPNPTG